MQRRQFIQKSALATAGALASSNLLACMPEERIKKFGVQIYTVRDNIKNDLKGTVKALSKIGYDYAELYNLGGGKVLDHSIKEAKEAFNAHRMEIKSIHCLTGRQAPEMTGTLINEWQRGVDDAAELGASYVVCAYLLDFERENIDQYKKLAELFNKAGEACKKNGIQFAYHNHEFEFIPLEGRVPYDILLKETDPDLVKMELDIYWARFANQDPLKLFKDNLGRFPLWHVKDMELGEERLMTEVGSGRIDWKQLFVHAADSGMEYFFVEQDRNWVKDPVSSLDTSYKFLKKMTY